MLIAAVDIGTSSTRALLFDDARFIGVSHQIEVALKADESGAAELDCAEVMNAVVQCVRTISGACPAGLRIEAVTLSSAMHSLVAVDHSGTPLMRAMTWADNRAAPQAAALKASAAGAAIYRATGVPMHPMAPLSKLCWLADERPVVFRTAAHFVSIKDYVVHWLFGVWITDHSIASSSGLFNLRERAWDAAALATAGIAADRLPALAPATHVLSGLIPAHADAMGLLPGTPFVLGASDGCLANLGGALGPGDAGGLKRAVLTIGTSGAVRMTVREPRTDAAMRTFCYALAGDEWVIGGATNGGGLPLRWLRDNFPQLRAGSSTDDPYSALAALAAQSKPGARGLLFHPYLAGERAPLWNADARGSFIGLNFQHGPADQVRAVMEGILFNLGMILAVLEELDGPRDEIIAGGGFANSKFWLQLAADVFNRPLVMSETVEATAQGAALLALVALGSCTSLEAARALLPMPDRRIMAGADAAVYARLQPVFASVPAKLAHVYAELSAFQRNSV